MTVIATYNNIAALNLVLLSATRQTRLPDEIIIADDGSTDATRVAIEQWQGRIACPIIHVWQEDKGYRRAKILNKAFAQSTSDYIVNIDGDMILHPCFIADHLRFARKNTFSAGGRVRIKPALTAQLLKNGNYALGFFTPQIKNRLNALHAPALTPLFYRRDHFRGCNIAFWRNDLLKVNGYDERYEGYGLEDYDLVVRLLRAGCIKRFVKFAAIAFHLHHEERDADGEARRRNKPLLEAAMASQSYAVAEGMAQYIP